LDSTNPFQREINLQVRRFSTIIREVATEENIDYISVYEAFSAQMKNSRRHPFSEFRFLAFYRDAFRTLVLGRSPDEVSRLNGWEFHTDGVHLNSRGGCSLPILCRRSLRVTARALKRIPADHPRVVEFLNYRLQANARIEWGHPF
jgi:hypothetical protein